MYSREIGKSIYSIRFSAEILVMCIKAEQDTSCSEILKLPDMPAEKKQVRNKKQIMHYCTSLFVAKFRS